MAKRKVSQEDLRKMMAQAKTSKPSASAPPVNKKYKLSSREMALLEEQKKEAERKKTKEMERKAAALAALPKPDAVPRKSILKNITAAVPIQRPPPPAAIAATVLAAQTSTQINSSSTGALMSIPSSSTKNDFTPDPKGAAETLNENEQSTALPEGFFDDPIADAKARNVQYVDTAEEEWSKFQKEIVEEMTVAQDILVEDRIEATNDRQIEEIDEQIRAWSRVAELEKKMEETGKQNPKHIKTSKAVESDEDEDEYEEFMDWRNKK